MSVTLFKVKVSFTEEFDNYLLEITEDFYQNFVYIFLNNIKT